MKHGTWVALRRSDEILLAMKKRGFGEGKWNGMGGKPEEGEAIEQAAARECREEIGVTIATSDLQKCGVITFRSATNPKFNWIVHMFFAEKWQGEPQETEEMRPQWFRLADIPYSQMFPDDQHWLPKVLAGKKILASFNWNAASDGFDDFKIEEVVSLEDAV